MRRWGKTTITCSRCKRVVHNQHHTARYCGWCLVEVLEQRARVTSKVVWAIKSGRLPSWRGLKCYLCGADAIGYEHRDYTKPLDVRPVCAPCNWMVGPAKQKREEELSA